MKCRMCNKNENIYGGLCQACYHYFKAGGTISSVPPLGTIKKDYRGYVICHICGRAYKRLGSHVRESHAMTIDEYKKVFGLCRNCKTTENTYSQTMRESAYQNNMPERLIKAGVNTRIKPGETVMRKGKDVRLQEILDRKMRQKSETKKK